MDGNISKSIRKSLTLSSKYDIIKRLQRGAKQSNVCSEMGLSKSTVGTIWRNKEKILKLFEGGQNMNVKKLKKPTHSAVDQELLKWFSQQRGKNAAISGAILQSKAEELGKKLLKDEEPKFSRSWVERFKKRHNITRERIVEESSAVDMDVVKKLLNNKWPTIRTHFKDDDMFNGDGTGAFYKLTSDQTLGCKEEKCEGGELSKERITVKDEDQDEPVIEESVPVPTTSEALKHIESVRNFLESKNTPQNVLDRLAEVELHISFTKIEQTAIID